MTGRGSDEECEGGTAKTLQFIAWDWWGECAKSSLVGIASRRRRAKRRGQRKSKRTADPSPREGRGMAAGRVGRTAARDGAARICYDAMDSQRNPEWRNWQTRRTQNPVAARPCGFDPLLRDHRIRSHIYLLTKIPVISIDGKNKLHDREHR